MAEIIPAIMPQSLEDLREKYSLVKDFAPLVQIDVMDGKFVPSKSWPYINENKGLPFSAEKGSPLLQADFEVDLMVENPETAALNWLEAGAKRIIVHIESVKNFAEIFDATAGKAELGIALDTATPNDSIYPFIDKVSFVQFMGIEKIGFQGQPFDERVLLKIADLREKFSDIIISVDGGVNLKIAPKLVAAGANRLVSGSAIFESEDIRKAIEQLSSV